MSYGCIVKGCDKPDGADGFKTQTAMLNHVRMTQNDNHNQMWNRIKRKQSNEDENEDQRVDHDDNSQDQEEDNSQPEENEQVTKLGDMQDTSEDPEESTNYVDIETVDLERLVENGLCDSLDHAVNKLEKARKKGFSKIDPETGEVE